MTFEKIFFAVRLAMRKPAWSRFNRLATEEVERAEPALVHGRVFTAFDGADGTGRRLDFIEVQGIGGRLDFPLVQRRDVVVVHVQVVMLLLFSADLLLLGKKLSLLLIMHLMVHDSLHRLLLVLHLLLQWLLLVLNLLLLHRLLLVLHLLHFLHLWQNWLPNCHALVSKLLLFVSHMK